MEYRIPLKLKSSHLFPKRSGREFQQNCKQTLNVERELSTQSVLCKTHN